jgi:hypothetical protein
MISVIVNSHRPQMAAEISAMYRRLLAGVPYEVIVIADAHSMCDGYTRGTRQAKGDVMVYSHHDIEYLFDDFVTVLEGALSRYDVIGVAGTDKLVNPIWTHAGIGHQFGQVVHPNNKGTLDVEVYAAPAPIVGGIMAMDGLFLAARREAVERVGWDGETFDGFHFYDIDFTFRAALAGLKLAVVPELGFFHSSLNGPDPNYATYEKRFAAKHDASIRPEPTYPFQVAIQRVPDRDAARKVLRPDFWIRP